MSLDRADDLVRTVDGPAGPYTVRPYEPGDRGDVVALYETVFGGDGDALLEWKYESNPFVDHVPMTVGAIDGRVVAVKPCLALPLRAGGETHLALQPADVAVHRDHRGNGLYSATTELLKDRYAEGEAALFFNFPNAATLSGSLKHGWRVVEEVTTHYRVARPSTLLGTDAPSLARTGGRPADAVLASYRRLRDALRRTPTDVAVTRHAGVPVERLSTLYERAVPDGFHAHRTPTYLRWRYDNPDWEYATYTATQRGRVAAALVVGTRDHEGPEIVSVVDVVPIEGTEALGEILRALLHEVLVESASASVVAASGTGLPDDVLAALGFRGDDRWPVSAVADRSTLVAYPLTDEEGWTVGGRSLTDPRNWHLTLSERDTR